jgi:tetratricopeptide (TPR) repeat protein
MSRFPEAEIFAREMVHESEKITPISDRHVMAMERLANILLYQDKFEAALSVAHSALERFRSVVPEGDAMVRLMEVESEVLIRLGRHADALVLQQHCINTRLENPTRFPNGGKLPSGSFYALGQSLLWVGQLDKAEEMFKKAQAMLESEGKDFHPDMVHVMVAIMEVYRQQGRKKEAASKLKTVKKLVPKVFPKDHPDYKKYMDL